MYLFQEALLCNDNKDFWWNSLKKFRNKPKIFSGKLTNNRLVCEYFTVINTLAFEMHEWIPLQNYHIGPRPNGLLGLESNPFIQMWQIKKVFSFKKSLKVKKGSLLYLSVSIFCLLTWLIFFQFKKLQFKIVVLPISTTNIFSN